MTRRTYDHLARLAHTHLADADFARWLGLLRPAVQLRHAREGHDVVARLAGTPALPTEGGLLAFYFDDPEGAGEAVLTGDPDSLPGSRLLHVRHTEPTTDPLVELAGVQVLTWPDREHPVLERHGLDELPDPFDEALGELLQGELGDV